MSDILEKIESLNNSKERVDFKIESLNNSKKRIDFKIENFKIKYFNNTVKMLLKDKIDQHKQFTYIQILKLNIKMTKFKFLKIFTKDFNEEEITMDENWSNNQDPDSEYYFYHIFWTIKIEDLTIDVICNLLVDDWKLNEYICYYINGIKIDNRELLDGFNKESNLYKLLKKSDIRKKYKISTENLHKLIGIIHGVYYDSIFKSRMSKGITFK